uniref:Uncharacterized protein n=1 Tax=Salix viminalis TaxID=40686 RepID=A0A6N2KQ08_SALVM
MYKHPTLVSILSISLSPSFLILLPQISLPPSLSASVHSISKKILDHLSDTPSKQLIVSPESQVTDSSNDTLVHSPSFSTEETMLNASLFLSISDYV